MPPPPRKISSLFDLFVGNANPGNYHMYGTFQPADRWNILYTQPP